MKKHNEGYALPFVLVVMTVLCLAAASLLTMAENNLKIQQKSVARMQDKYEAAGAIEIVTAELANLTAAEGKDEQAAIQNKITAICEGVYEDGAGSDPTPEFPEPASPAAETDDEAEGAVDAEKDFEYSFKVTSRYDSVSIACELKLTGKIKATGTVGLNTSYTISSPEVTYISYEVGGAE